MSESCSWCGDAVPEDGGFRVMQPESGLRVVFCRLEHVVPWAMKGAIWEAPESPGDIESGVGLGVCAQCGAGLDADAVLLVRHRGAHRIADAFCDVEHLSGWAKRGGRFRAGA